MKHVNDILIRTRVTEKSALQAEQEKGKVYTFEVAPCANKHEVAAAVKSVYGVTPAKVRVINVRARQVVSRGKRGTQAGFRKALVYVKPGQTIVFA